MNFDKYAEHANAFVREVQLELGIDDFHQAGRVLRAVLHALRSRLTPQESFKLIAQLPMFIKAIYIDGWRMSQSPNTSIGDVGNFVAEVQRQAGPEPPLELVDTDRARRTTQIVLHVLKRHITPGERDDVAAELPEKLEAFWVAA